MQTVDLVKAVVNSEHGWAVADQFLSTFNGEVFEEQNYNALMYIRESVRDVLSSDLLSENAHDELQTYSDNLEDYIAEAEYEIEDENGEIYEVERGEEEEDDDDTQEDND